MAPSATEDSASRREAWKNLPSPTLYPVKEAKFEKYLTPQVDGHERALAQPEGTVAIVIDNGMCYAPWCLHATQWLTRGSIDPWQAPPLFEQAGPSSPNRDYPFLPSWPSIATASSARPSPLQDRTAMPTRQHEDTSATHLRLGRV
jgi:hypothetical protein